MPQKWPVVVIFSLLLLRPLKKAQILVSHDIKECQSDKLGIGAGLPGKGVLYLLHSKLHYFLESLFNKREMSNVRNVTSSYTELNLVLLSLKPFGTTIGINEWIIMFDKCLNVFSSQMINWHPWQLKKSKSWRPFWRYQLNSTTNPGHLPRKWANTLLFSWYVPSKWPLNSIWNTLYVVLKSQIKGLFCCLDNLQY